MRDLHRLHEIASILIRYGWGDLVRVLGLALALDRAGRILHWQTTTEISRLDPFEIVKLLNAIVSRDENGMLEVLLDWLAIWDWASS